MRDPAYEQDIVMSQTVGDFFWQRMHEWGAKTVFGYPGDGINGLLGALNRTNGYVDEPEQLAPAWESALASDRPVVLEVTTDPEVPPLLPHITLKQAKNFASAILAPDPRETRTLVGAAKEVLSSVLPGRK